MRLLPASPKYQLRPLRAFAFAVLSVVTATSIGFPNGARAADAPAAPSAEPVPAPATPSTAPESAPLGTEEGVPSVSSDSSAEDSDTAIEGEEPAK